MPMADLRAAAKKLEIDYVVFMAAAFKAKLFYPYYREHRREGFRQALLRFPNDRVAQGRFVGLTARQFRASALRYGLIEASGHTVPGALNRRT